MRKQLLIAAAVAALASPAIARDGSPYVGIEGGLMKVRDANLDYQGITADRDTGVSIDHKLGLDVDAVAGYDFGPVRAEAELGFKRAGIDQTDVDVAPFGTTFSDGGKGRTVSLMGNLLADFGDENGTSFYIGGGAGVARTKYKIDAISFGGTDPNFAWQGIAGVRTAISDNVDLGLKYRYFRTKYNIEESQAEEVIGKWRSHSLLASLIFNFGGAPEAAPPPPPPPPPAPPPPPPQTQTCPDGSVILATDTCPVPPPPPPPPPPTVERG